MKSGMKCITTGLFKIFILTLSWGSLQAQVLKNLPQLGKDPVKEVIEAMTLAEKVNLVGGMGRLGDAPQEVSGIRMYGVPGAAATTYPIPRLGIPAIILSDGPAVVRIDPHRQNSEKKYYATAFPVATLLASSWDKELVKEVGTAFGKEILEYGVDVILAPGMNIQRNPLGGRNFEYYSEDPYLSGHIAAAMVNGIQSEGVGATIKHLAVNSEETNRLRHSSELTERTLREIYLSGFEIAIKESNPWLVMSSYNLINGIFASESSELLTTILRNEWGYGSCVVSDWGAGLNSVEQMKAGNDLIMPGNWELTKAIYDAVNEGRLDEKILDRNIERILSVIAKSPSLKKYAYSDQPPFEANGKIVRRAAAESMVLLKNEKSTLPLDKNQKIALFGCTSYDNMAGGFGSGGVHKAYNISLNQGLTSAGFEVDSKLVKVYDEYVKEQNKIWKIDNPMEISPSIPEMEVSESWIKLLAKQMDVAVITIGRNSGEGSDLSEKAFGLIPEEAKLIENVSREFHAMKKKVIIVMNISNVMEVASWRNYADAILLAWQGGQEGGNSITDILCGAVNPSGKLTASFPMTYRDVPSYNNFPGTPKDASNPECSLYEEGIYLGYRYYNTFGIRPAYEFGYGLSYSHFAYSDLKISSDIFHKKMKVQITITNKGEYPSKEVVQLYLKAPAIRLEKPVNELKGFAKTKLLQSGESQVLEFELDSSSLASYDASLSSWIAEKGKYTIQMGASSLDIRKKATFKLVDDILVERCHTVLPLKREIKELTHK